MEQNLKLKSSAISAGNDKFGFSVDIHQAEWKTDFLESFCTKRLTEDEDYTKFGTCKIHPLSWVWIKYQAVIPKLLTEADSPQQKNRPSNAL